MSNIKFKDAVNFYKSYQWKKVNYITYISRVNHKKLPFEIAIKPESIFNKSEMLKEKRKKYRESNPDYIYYNNYKWDKVWYRYFQAKLKLWMPKEDAIRKECKVLKFRKTVKNLEHKKYTEKIVQKPKNKSYYYVEVTYPKEVATIYRAIYIKKIQDIEDELFSWENNEIHKLEKKLKHLKKELKVFNKRNPY